MGTKSKQIGLFGNFITQALFVILALYLLFCGSYNYSVDKVTSFFMLLLFLGTFVGFVDKQIEFPKILTPISICVTAYICVYSLSVFYASTGNFALVVYSRYVSGFAAFFLAVFLVNKNPAFVRPILFVSALSIAIAGIFSIDAASCHFLTQLLENNYRAFFNFGELFLGPFEEGTRMTSIIGSPNVFGGLCGLGVLCSAYLYITAEKAKEKCASSITLGICAVSLLYCFSLGSLLSMSIAVVVLFFFFGKENWTKLLFVTLTTVLLAFVSVFIGFSSMGKTGFSGILPLISLAAAVILLYFILQRMEKAAKWISAIQKKTAAALLFGVGALLVVLAVLALTLTKPSSFSEQNDSVRRSFMLPNGTAQLTAAFSGSIPFTTDILIESQSYDQASTHTSSVLFRDKISVDDETTSIPFTIPEDADICFVTISAPAGTKLLSLSAANDSTATTIKTDYRLLPTFMVNRLQGITVNQNAAQRFVFYKDGIKIFLRSPIWGNGPGAFESKILEVQDYYYETNSAHNHYIQTLDEVGLLGFLPFAGVLLLSVFYLLRGRKDQEQAPLRATLLACVIMVIVHASMEFTFTFGFYIILAFMLFGITSALFAQKLVPLRETKRKYFQVPILAAAAIAMLLYVGQFTATQMLKSALQSGSVYKLLDTLGTCTVLDFTNRVSHKGSYLMNLPANADADYIKRAEEYAAALEKHNSFSSLKTLYTFYFNQANYEEAFRIINKRMRLVKHNPTEWNDTFAIYASMMQQIASQDSFALEFMPVLVQYIDEAYQQFLAYNETTPVPVTLTAENQAMLAKMQQLRDHPKYTLEELLQIVNQ